MAQSAPPSDGASNSASEGDANGSPLAHQINSASLAFFEQQYLRYQERPESLPQEWRDYFDLLEGEDVEDGEERGLGAANGSASNGSTAVAQRSSEPLQLGPTFRPRGLFHVPAGEAAQSVLQERVGMYVRNVRVRGHAIAKIDPLGQPQTDPPELYPEVYQIAPEDYHKPVMVSHLAQSRMMTFAELDQSLRNTYCRSIGVQFMHIDSYVMRTWLQEQMESTENRLDLSREDQIHIFKKLTDAVVFEDFLEKKFVGEKAFSLRGAETLIPLLDLAIDHSAEDGVDEVVLAMAHRGRLNVLANIMGKMPRDIFAEFDDADPEAHIGSWDVKYHMGASKEWTTRSGKKLHISLCYNPSHLEYVNGVALGKIRSKQDRIGDKKRRWGLAILIHGDAAFAGEGVVQETLNMSELKGYKTGGTLHVIVNNQIGFTTDPGDGRSCDYATDIAKFLQVPIFHVNGEDPEAVAQVVRLATKFRAKFHKDVVIDLYCYRYHGHNESDEPFFTQPVMYKEIRTRDSVRKQYLKHLQSSGEVTAAEAKQIRLERKAELDRELDAAKSEGFTYSDDTRGGVWSGYFGGPASKADHPDTTVAADRLEHVTRTLGTVPDHFTPHKTIQKMLDTRVAMAEGEQPYDWATAELAAMGTLGLTQIESSDSREYPHIRLSGQDCKRGTFSQRHAVVYDVTNGVSHHPLHHLARTKRHQAIIEVINSPLAEAGVLGFEYGYSVDCPNSLIMWEAQFGDFANAAQVVIDQFITTAEDKWDRLSGLVMLLPHGFEGQGPEHSSARIERFLTNAAEDNFQIIQATTPAQHFHCLRRQTLRKWRKPLVAFTPKSMLRHPECKSEIKEFTSGGFREVIPDTLAKDPKKVSHVLLCSGKVYYELLGRIKKEERTDVAVIRVEQLYPRPLEELKAALTPYPEDAPVVWVQEEPENMGAWRFQFCHYGPTIEGHPFSGVSRPESSSPATGSKKSHAIEQKRLLDRAMQKPGS